MKKQKYKKEHKVHVVYMTDNKVGEIAILQNVYYPIIPTTLNEIRELIRKENEIPTEKQIIILSWQRFEK